MTQRRKIQQCTKHVCRSHLKYFHLFRVVLPCVLYCWNTCKYSSKVCIGLLIFLHSIPCFLCKRLCSLNQNLISRLFCSVSHLHVMLHVILCPNIKKLLRYRYKSYTNKCVYIYIYMLIKTVILMVIFCKNILVSNISVFENLHRIQC